MKTIFLYAGQGSQKEQMGMDLYETFPEYREIIDSLKLPNCLDVPIDLKYLMHEGSLDLLSQTQFTQPCMAAFAAGVTNVLKKNNILPYGACGLSLGEYGALHAANVFDANTYVSLTAFRGQEMAKAAEGKICAMSAILGMEAEVVESACMDSQSEGFVKVVNYNCPGQQVICGEETAVTATGHRLQELGAKRFVRLKVSGPFHTKYMEPAAKALREYMKDLEFQAPTIPITLNVTGDFYQPEEDLRDLLEKQVQTGVQFEQDLRKFLETGANTFIEIGPGNALTGFVKKTARALGTKVTTYTIDSAASLCALLEKKEELSND